MSENYGFVLKTGCCIWFMWLKYSQKQKVFLSFFFLFLIFVFVFFFWDIFHVSFLPGNYHWPHFSTWIKFLLSTSPFTVTPLIMTLILPCILSIGFLFCFTKWSPLSTGTSSHSFPCPQYKCFTCFGLTQNLLLHNKQTTWIILPCSHIGYIPHLGFQDHP